MQYSVKYLIDSDLTRYGVKQRFGLKAYFRYVWWYPTPGIVFSFAFRLCQHYRRRNRLLFYLFYLWLRRVKFKYGIDISYRATIGPGLYIGHFGGIVVHGDATIGANCNLSQGITIGVLNRGKIGIPVIGDRVFIGPGAVILGGISVGNDVLIGANAVVNFDVPDRSVVAAPASTIISDKGSTGYVEKLANH